MTIILAFDTSGPWCTACLLADGAVRTSREETMARGQAERLMPMLEEMLEGAGLTWGDPVAIGVGTGPGTFTGVRIAVAAARGLALARSIPAIGVTALEAAASGAPDATVVAPSGPGWFGVQDPGEAPRLVPEGELPDAGLVGWAPGALPPAEPLAVAVARIAASRLAAPQPRPSPLYLRPPDAAPPRLAAPPIAAG